MSSRHKIVFSPATKYFFSLRSQQRTQEIFISLRRVQENSTRSSPLALPQKHNRECPSGRPPARRSPPRLVMGKSRLKISLHATRGVNSQTKMTNDPSCNASLAVFTSSAEVVCIPYDDLITASRGDRAHAGTTAIHQLVEDAFSSFGLGIIAITDVPNASQLRLRLLPLAQRLAKLSPDQLEEITVPESDYQVGWVSL